MKQVKKSADSKSASAKAAAPKKAPAAKKSASRKPAQPTLPSMEVPVAAAPVAPAIPAPTPEERYKMIQDAAYFIAERHGFQGDSAYFWSLAEAQIKAQLGE